MRETLGDKTVSLLQAVGIHVLAVLAMLLGLQLSEPIKLSGGAPLEAVMVDLSNMRSLPKPAPTPPKPAPEPTPPPPAARAEPPPPPPTPTPPEPLIEQEQAAARQSQLAAQQAAEAERLRVQQQEREKVERQKEQERQKELEKIRAEREKAEQQSKLEAQRLAQLKQQQTREAEQRKAAAAVAAQQAAAQAADNEANSLLNQYAALIQEVVTQSWRRPPNAPAGIRCVLRVRQIPGGEVIGVSIGSPCNATGAVQQSILEAVERASPLPYSGFEQVFARDLNFTFVYNG